MPTTDTKAPAAAGPDPPAKAAPRRTSPPPGAPRHSRARTWAGAIAAVAAILIALLLYFGWVAPYFTNHGTGTSPGSTPGQGIAPVNQSLLGADGCNAVTSLTPSAILIPLNSPNAPLAPNAEVTASYEFAVVNYTSADHGDDLFIPSMTVVFPTSTGTSLEMIFPPAAIQPSGAGWESPSFATRSTSTTTALTFTSSPAYITSSRLAVMANVPYGQIALEFRWHWAVSSTSGPSLASNWSDPTPNVDWPTSLPSIFLPAPLVTLVQDSGTTWTIGQNFTVWIGGDTGGRNFTLALEPTSSGVEVQHIVETVPPGNASSVPLTLPLIGDDGVMLPGSYLVHVHDSCGAIVKSITVNTIYAPNATISFAVTPSSCGGIEFDNQSYSSGSNVTVPPSPNPYSYAIGTCGGASFTNRTTTGGVHIISDTTLLVSASGTIAVTYP